MNEPEEAARRQQRLSAALRENLKRRKAQFKGRSAAENAVEQAAKPHDSAGIGEDKEARDRTARR